MKFLDKQISTTVKLRLNNCEGEIHHPFSAENLLLHLFNLPHSIHPVQELISSLSSLSRPLKADQADQGRKFVDNSNYRRKL